MKTEKFRNALVNSSINEEQTRSTANSSAFFSITQNEPRLFFLLHVTIVFAFHLIGDSYIFYNFQLWKSFIQLPFITNLYAGSPFSTLMSISDELVPLVPSNFVTRWNGLYIWGTHGWKVVHFPPESAFFDMKFSYKSIFSCFVPWSGVQTIMLPAKEKIWKRGMKVLGLWILYWYFKPVTIQLDLTCGFNQLFRISKLNLQIIKRQISLESCAIIFLFKRQHWERRRN